MACFTNKSVKSSAHVFCELAGESNPLISKKVIDAPNPISIKQFLIDAETRLNCKLCPFIEFVDDSKQNVKRIDGDLHLAELLGSLELGGTFRFHRNVVSTAIPTATIPTKSTPIVTSFPSRPNSLQLIVNGKQILVRDPQPSMLLVDFLRDNLRLTGTKIGCGEGGCGACTVMVKAAGAEDNQAVPINSCLRLLCSCDGLEITTVEGLGSEATEFSDVQKAIADGNGSQCGYCTPGWVVNMSALMAANPTPTAAEVEQHFDGNICRCTGYRPILEAFQGVAEKARQIECRLDLNQCGDMEDIAGEATCCNSKKGKAVKKGGCCKSRRDPPPVETLHYTAPLTRDEYWRPSTLDQMVELVNSLENSPSPMPKSVQLVAGNTGMAVGKYYDAEAWNYGQPKEGDNVVVDVKGVPELLAISSSDDGLSVGAAVTIADLISTLEDSFGSDHAVYAGVIRHLKRVANTQVRSAGSWVGNLALLANNPTFNSDVSIITATLGVQLVVVDMATGASSSIAVEDWLAQGGGGLVVSGLFPLYAPQDGATYLWYSDKTGQRHVNSHAITNAGFLLTINSSDSSITSARATVGGLLDGFARLTSVESSLIGGYMNEVTFQQGLKALNTTVQAAGGPSKDPQNSAKYRLALARSFLYKLFLTYCSSMNTLSRDLLSACKPFAAAEDRPVSRGHQLFHVDDPSTAPVGEYITKLSARIQASGEAKYSSDLGSKACLYASFVLSDCSLAKLDSIDATQAMTCPGVVQVITAADVPGKNQFYGRECLFVNVGENSPYVGAPVAVVVADTLKRSRAAAKKVTMNWSDLKPGEYVPEPDVNGDGPEWLEFSKGPLSRRMKVRKEANGKKIVGASVETGDVDNAFAQAQSNGLVVAGGRLHMSGQKHFFLETHTTLATPDEDRRIIVNTATQFGQYSQQMLAVMLGLPAHRIEVKTRRVGGAYGGKITQNVWTAGASCVAALVVGQPVLMHNERVDDMTMFGGREPMEVSYHVGFTDGSAGHDAGRIQALDMFYAMDGSYDAPESLGSLSMATQWSDSCYYVPDFRSKGTVRYSARAGHTSCRAPGNLQSISMREIINEHVAKKLGLPHIVIQERNMYAYGQTTPFGDVIGSDGFNWNIPELWRRTKHAVGYHARVAAVDAFNAANRFRKRGVCLVPTKYGFSPAEYKVGCLVNIFAADGTVEVHHSGSELGQGINTKVAQAVALGLGISMDNVVIADNSTAVVPNAGCTGGSGTSEACVGAAILACQELMNRLKPYFTDSTTSWVDAVGAASAAGVGLTYNGWFNMQPPTTATFEYATQGVGFAEVEIDCLTGEVQILRCDLHMDLGYSLNPAIDIGQVEGGFIMALGYMLTEEVIYSAPKREGVALDQHAPNQIQVNLGTWLYKPPSALDIPQVLNITLMPHTPNPSQNAVLSSKGCGEPPMALACAVALAVKQAIYACRKSLTGIDDHIQLDLPLSVERIQAACLAQDSLHLE